MIRARTTVGMLVAHRKDPGVGADIADLFQALAKALFDPYRPELHYMRGPGPKWHAKHNRPRAADAMSALMPARARDAVAVPVLIRQA